MCWKPVSYTDVVWAIDTLEGIQGASHNDPWWLLCLGELGMLMEVSISLLGCGAGPHGMFQLWGDPWDLLEDAEHHGSWCLCAGWLLPELTRSLKPQLDLVRSLACAQCHGTCTSLSSGFWPSQTGFSYLSLLSHLCGAFFLCEASKQ